MRISCHFKKSGFAFFFLLEPFHLLKLSLHLSASKRKTKEDGSEKGGRKRQGGVVAARQ